MIRPRAHGLTRSVQDRLRNLAKVEGRPYAELLQLYALERFLYRLSRSPHRDSFVLKGALMMHVWEGLPSRPTRDIDLLGPLGITEVEVGEAIRDCLDAAVVEDGIELDGTSLRIRPIRVAELHVGFRGQLEGFLARSRLRFQIDIGTGDGVVPKPVRIDYPTLLDFPSPRIRAYTPYTTIAEKFEALVKLDLANTRMKDFFDLDLLATRLDLDGDILAEALKETFASRGIQSSPMERSSADCRSGRCGRCRGCGWIDRGRARGRWLDRPFLQGSCILPVRTRCGWSPTGTLATSFSSSQEITATRSSSLTET